MPPHVPPPGPALAAAGIAEGQVYRTLFAAYPDALVVADSAGHIVLANPTAAALLGYTTEELCHLSVDALVPDAIRPRHASYREGYVRAPRPRPMGNQMDLVARRKDGSEVLVEIALSPLQHLGLPLVVAAIRDVGAYPRVRQALQRARYSEHLAQLGRLAVDARDPRRVLEQVPATAVEALQVKTAVVYLLEPDREAFRIAGGVGLAGGEVFGAHVPNRPDTAPGYVVHTLQPVVVADFASESRYPVPREYLEAGWASALSVPLLDRGRAIGAIDVRSRQPGRFGEEEQRFLESLSSLLTTSLQRAESEEALEHAQRLESVGQLTGGIAHDFNNLLTVIQGNLQVLEELPELAADTAAQQLVGAATRAARRGAELTGKLLAFSRRQVLQPTALDMATLLGALSDMLRRTLDQRIRIAVDVSPDCPRVLADPGQLESALLNIAINARDAMPSGGTLRFRAASCPVLPGTLALDLHDAPRADGYVAISIADTGTGMPDEVKKHAFEPFFTTKPAGRGTGLGLSTVYGFVKQSNGVLALDSAPGAGTTLTLYIPCLHERSEGDGDGDATRPLAEGLRVLLVEDDAEVRAVMLRFLETLRCQVTTAVSAEQALPLLQPGARFDVLLTDIALGPGMRGTQLAHQAQQRLPRLAVLLMSGYPAELLQADQEAPAGWDLLRKPCTREELAAAIARVVNRG